MSKGTPIVALRLARHIIEEIDRQCEASVQVRLEGPHTRTSWILEAIRQKLSHQARARKSSQRRKTSG